MAEKLSITIALEGGKQLEQQLEGIGKAGQKAFEEIEKAATKAGGFKNLKPEEVTQKLKDIGIVGTEAFNKIQAAVASASNWERVVVAVQGVEKGFAGLVGAAAGFAKALGPIGVAAGAIGGAVVKGMTEAAEAINKVDTAAIKAGMSIENFSKLQKILGGAGISAGAAAEGIGKIGSAVEQAKLDQVATDFKALQEAATRGYGGQGTAEWQRLSETVAGVGPASDAARTALEKLGAVNIPEGPVQRIRGMISATGDGAEAARLFISELEKMPDSLNRNATAAALLGQTFGTEVIQTLRTGNLTAAQFDQVVSTLSQNQANSSNALQQSYNKLSSTYENLKTTLLAKLGNAGLTSFLERVNTLLKDGASWEQWAQAGKDAFTTVFGPLGELEVKLAKLIGGAIWDGFKIAGELAIDAILTALDKLWEKLKGIGSAIANAFKGGGGTPGETTPIPGNASGGLIGGRGSGTSDSNLAWVSRGEHIMPARAVRQPGVLALLEALRRSGGSLRGVMDGMGRFAGGGMVPRLPAFAAGGLVGGMPHLGTVDLRTDHGSARLMAGASAMEQLSRLAVTKRMTSTGKKPGFVS